MKNNPNEKRKPRVSVLISKIANKVASASTRVLSTWNQFVVQWRSSVVKAETEMLHEPMQGVTTTVIAPFYNEFKHQHLPFDEFFAKKAAEIKEKGNIAVPKKVAGKPDEPNEVADKKPGEPNEAADKKGPIAGADKKPDEPNEVADKKPGKRSKSAIAPDSEAKKNSKVRAVSVIKAKTGKTAATQRSSSVKNAPKKMPTAKTGSKTMAKKRTDMEQSSSSKDRPSSTRIVKSAAEVCMMPQNNVSIPLDYQNPTGIGSDPGDPPDEILSHATFTTQNIIVPEKHGSESDVSKTHPIAAATNPDHLLFGGIDGLTISDGLATSPQAANFSTGSYNVWETLIDSGKTLETILINSEIGKNSDVSGGHSIGKGADDLDDLGELLGGFDDIEDDTPTHAITHGNYFPFENIVDFENVRAVTPISKRGREPPDDVFLPPKRTFRDQTRTDDPGNLRHDNNNIGDANIFSELYESSRNEIDRIDEEAEKLEKQKEELQLQMDRMKKENE